VRVIPEMLFFISKDHFKLLIHIVSLLLPWDCFGTSNMVRLVVPPLEKILLSGKTNIT
jgi:hypothetical protein